MGKNNDALRARLMYVFFTKKKNKTATISDFEIYFEQYMIKYKGAQDEKKKNEHLAEIARDNQILANRIKVNCPGGAKSCIQFNKIEKTTTHTLLRGTIYEIVLYAYRNGPCKISVNISDIIVSLDKYNHNLNTGQYLIMDIQDFETVKNSINEIYSDLYSKCKEIL